MKECSRCHNVKPLELFFKNSSSPDGRRSVCSDCESESRRVDYLNNRRDYTLQKTYGISLLECEALLATQGGVCANLSCSKPLSYSAGHKTDRPYVDHDHDTGEIRGLLCQRCNTAIGMLDDSPELLQGAIHYLTGHRDRLSESDPRSEGQAIVGAALNTKMQRSAEMTDPVVH